MRFAGIGYARMTFRKFGVARCSELGCNLIKCRHVSTRDQDGLAVEQAPPFRAARNVPACAGDKFAHDRMPRTKC